MRKPVVKLPMPPSKSYTYLNKLDAKGWLEEITRLYKLSVEHNLKLHPSDPNIFVYPTVGVSGQQTGMTIGQIGEPALRLGHRKDHLNVGPWLPLSINLAAADATIMAEFACVLRGAREQVPPPVVKRGKQTLKGLFDKGTAFKTWRQHKIVELADLFAWRATLSPEIARHYPDHKLGEDFLHFVSNPRNETNMAKRVLKTALGSLPALATQVAQSMTASEAPDLIAARVGQLINS